MMTSLTAEDGHSLGCWIEPAQGARRGGIVVLQEIFGVTDQLKGVAKRYAALGYEVGVPALFDRQERDVVVPFDQGSKGRDLMLASKLDETMLDTAAAVKKLAEGGGNVGVIGFCWGGGLAVRAAQKLDIAAAVSFYGTRLPQYLDSPLRAPLQGHFGAHDDHTPAEVLSQAQDYLGAEFEIFTYDAGHAFANEARPSFVPDAAETAHRRAAAFFAKHLG